METIRTIDAIKDTGGPYAAHGVEKLIVNLIRSLARSLNTAIIATGVMCVWRHCTREIFGRITATRTRTAAIAGERRFSRFGAAEDGKS